MPVLPSFNLSDVITILTVIRITNESGSLLPFICERNKKTFAFEAPQHPIDSNLKISDTLWAIPQRITFEGVVPAKSWDTFEQMIKGEMTDGGSLSVGQTIKQNIFGANAGGKDGNLVGLGLYTITTLSGIYKNMALISAEFEESAEMNSAYRGSLTFQECPQVKASSADFSADKIANVTDGDTVKTGQQTVKEEAGMSIMKMAQKIFNGG